jgi:hypothetical protein
MCEPSEAALPPNPQLSPRESRRHVSATTSADEILMNSNQGRSPSYPWAPLGNVTRSYANR